MLEEKTSISLGNEVRKINIAERIISTFMDNAEAKLIITVLI